MNSPNWRRAAVLSAVLGALLVLVGCGSSVQGTYTSTSGTVILELRSGGEASLSMMGETHSCTYKVSGKTVHLTCGPDKMDMRIMGDGSLNTNSMLIGVLRKSK